MKQLFHNRMALSALVALALFMCTGRAGAMDINGTITKTLIIYNNSSLVGDVTCTVVNAPCIQFGTDDITLRLNGFTITGLADPITGCGPTSTGGGPTPMGAFLDEDGIATAGFGHLQILGPGLVRNFRGVGVFLQNGTTKSKVWDITTSTNCICGVLLATSADDNDVEENVVVRIGNFTSPCGGINISSNNNRVRRNVLGGNGYVNATNNNFGIEINGTGNLVEENSAIGNADGIRLTPAASGNLVRRNIVTGNPPIAAIQVSSTFGGVDILDLASVSANTFEDNLCLTSNVGGLCPNIPTFAKGDQDRGDRH